MIYAAEAACRCNDAEIRLIRYASPADVYGADCRLGRVRPQQASKTAEVSFEITGPCWPACRAKQRGVIAAKRGARAARAKVARAKWRERRCIAMMPRKVRGTRARKGQKCAGKCK